MAKQTTMTEKLYRNRANALLNKVLTELSQGYRCEPNAKYKFTPLREEGVLLNEIHDFLHNSKIKLS